MSGTMRTVERNGKVFAAWKDGSKMFAFTGAFDTDLQGNTEWIVKEHATNEQVAGPFVSMNAALVYIDSQEVS